jgi:TrpR family trp operon transcriptional repressor
MKTNKEGWDKFISLCQALDSPKNLSSLFDLLLTPQEIESIALRCLIIKELLEEQRPQREIAKKLKVSIAKITRGSNEIKRMDRKFLSLIKQLVET